MMTTRNSKIGVLLLNVGTPDAPTPREVRRYLREFLGDPRVLDMRPLGRWALLNLVILPFRPRRSAEAYRAIWTPEGSPLLLHGQALARALAEALGERFSVALAMRYGRPSVAAALDAFHAEGVDDILAFPLFPQHASATTGTALAHVYRLAADRWNVPRLATVSPFFDDAGFIAAFAEVGRPALAALAPDHILFSFHGLPERQVRRSDPTGAHCLAREDCCAAVTATNRHCYRAQSFATARAIARTLALPDASWSVAFQSRLGRTPWLRPYTDETVEALARRGVKRLAVFCPAFVADCLETLEEIGLRARESFRRSGGDELVLVPSLNAHPRWVEAAAALVRAAVEGAQDRERGRMSPWGAHARPSSVAAHDAPRALRP